MKCNRMFNRVVCGGPVAEHHNRITGALRFVCAWCERKRLGLCRDCPARLAKPQALRCKACHRVHRKKYDLHHARLYVERHREVVKLVYRRKQYGTAVMPEVADLRRRGAPLSPRRKDYLDRVQGRAT